jgi:type IV pilus biogenesis protein PilP
MRIAAKLSLSALLAVGAVFAAVPFSSPLHAAGTVGGDVVDIGSDLSDVGEKDVSSNKNKEKAKPSKKADEKLIENGGIPSSVQSVVKKLNGATDDLTLEDLNDAREAAAKLDVLLDIEKKLTDLAKIRSERDKDAAATAMSSMLPMSAIQSGPISKYQIPSNALEKPAEPSRPAVVRPAAPRGPEKVDVERISGTVGRYVAVYKDKSDETHQVRAGDKMPDGSKVVAISRRGVTLSKDGQTLILPVKDVENIFGAK